MEMDIADVVDLARYPIADLASPQARAVIAEGRRQLAADGLCLFPDFLTPQALAALVEEARRLEPQQHHDATWITGIGQGQDDGPLHRPMPNACGAIAYDRLGTDSVARRVYELDQLPGLFARLLGLPALYRCADPISSCLVMYYREGDELGWHFDPNDGVVTLLVQAAEEGGAFEFAPGVGRDPTAFDPIMDGRRAGVVTPPIRPGTLSLFRGLNALHRVTRVAGKRSRIMLTMSFDPQPGRVFSLENRRRYSGREVEIAGEVMR
jgi:alkylated DNA repair dioxygenase AlkB